MLLQIINEYSAKHHFSILLVHGDMCVHVRESFLYTKQPHSTHTVIIYYLHSSRDTKNTRPLKKFSIFNLLKTVDIRHIVNRQLRHGFSISAALRYPNHYQTLSHFQSPDCMTAQYLHALLGNKFSTKK